MPCRITWEARGVCKKCSGFVSSAEFAASTHEIHADWRFDDMRYLINDLTEVTGHDVTPATVDALAVQWLGAGMSNPRIRIAFVTTDPWVVGMIRHYVAEGLVPCPVESFPTVAAARAWTGA